MRWLGKCSSEYAVNVADSQCSGSSSPTEISPAGPFLVRSVYKAKSCNDKMYLITLTWSNSHRPKVAIRDPATGFDSYHQLKRKLGKKGCRLHDSQVELIWDISRASYGTSPEPSDDFYLTVVIGSESAVALGSMEGVKNPKAMNSSLVSRSEYFSRNTVYSTRVRFFSSGTVHDLTIKYAGEDDRSPVDPVVSVCVDDKRIVQVERLKWNFRGNQTIFVDGVLIDMMWDLHDWLFELSSNGSAVFMFKTRDEMSTSRLWMEDNNLLLSDDKANEFSLLICASR